MAVLKRVEILSKNRFQVRDYVHLLMREKRCAKKIHYSREAAAALNKITGNRSRTNEQKIKASFGPESQTAEYGTFRRDLGCTKAKH